MIELNLLCLFHTGNCFCFSWATIPIKITILRYHFFNGFPFIAVTKMLTLIKRLWHPLAVNNSNLRRKISKFFQNIAHFVYTVLTKWYWKEGCIVFHKVLTKTSTTYSKEITMRENLNMLFFQREDRDNIFGWLHLLIIIIKNLTKIMSFVMFCVNSDRMIK